MEHSTEQPAIPTTEASATLAAQVIASLGAEVPKPIPARKRTPAAPVDHALLAEQLKTMTAGGGVHVDIPQTELDLLHLLITNPGASYITLLGDEHGVKINVDGVTVPNFAEALNAPAKFSEPAVRANLKRLRAIMSAAEAVRESQARIKQQLVRNAQQAVRKVAGGRAFLEMDTLTQRLRAISLFTNPLELDHRASKRTSSSGSSVYVYLSASAIAPCESGDHDQAVANLMARFADHTAVLESSISKKVGSVNRRVVPVPGAYRDNQVAAQLQYGLQVDSTAQFKVLIEDLEKIGELSALDVSVCSDDLLRYNASYGLEGYEDSVYSESHEGSDAATLELAI